MSADHVEIIDRSVEKAHVWLKDLAEELGGQDLKTMALTAAGDARNRPDPSTLHDRVVATLRALADPLDVSP
jgi:hypothetical protein